jgi:methionine synthase / methylenetetrahydrofolate reductase(NADPH)
MDLLGELGKRVVCGDGAMGTLLLDAGVPLKRCFEALCLSEPERIRKIHEEYVGAGARVIETNTLGANAVRLGRFGLGDRVGEINRVAVELARSAAKDRSLFIAGSVGPLGITAEEAAVRDLDRTACFREQITALVEAGVDLIFFETFTDFAEIQVALRARNEVGSVAAICSFACRPDGKLRWGMLLKDAFRRLQDEGAELMGVNCMNDPKEMVTLLEALSADYPLAVYPTAGRPRLTHGRATYDVTPEMFAASARDLIAHGARLLGGCCGTTPLHIAAMGGAIRDEDSA